MSSPFYVGFQDSEIDFAYQFQNPYADGDAGDNCGCCVDQMALRLYGKKYDQYTCRRQIGRTGVTYAGDRQNNLMHFAGVGSEVMTPTTENGPGGLLRIIWQSLLNRIPVALATVYLDANGNPTKIPHWVLAYGLSDTTVFEADPATGRPRHESYDQCFAHYNGVIVVPTVSVP